MSSSIEVRVGFQKIRWDTPYFRASTLKKGKQLNESNHIFQVKERLGEEISSFCFRETSINQRPYAVKLKQLHVLLLPTELLLHVFRFLSYQQLAETTRLVCRRFAAVAALRLNTAVPTLRCRALRYLRIVRGFRRAETALRDVRSQLDQLHAVTWRYVRPVYPDIEPRACFYGGIVLDMIVRILQRGPAALGVIYYRRQANGSERARLATLAKRFMNHWERFTEQKLLRRPADSGAKIVDLLDCLEGRDARTLHSELAKFDPLTGWMRYVATYLIRRAWFVRLECLAPRRVTPRTSWRDEVSSMNLRIRRLVSSHNKHQLHSAPPASIYTGYGRNGNDFFYYGSMNRAAARLRFHNEDDNLLNVFIHVDLTCPADLAPYLSYKEHNPANLGPLHPAPHNRFKLTLEISSPENAFNQLPTVFHWELPTT